MTRRYITLAALQQQAAASRRLARVAAIAALAALVLAIIALPIGWLLTW